MFFKSFKSVEKYRGANIYHCESHKVYYAHRFKKDFIDYGDLFKSKEYKSISWCRKFVDKFYEENGGEIQPKHIKESE